MPSCARRPSLSHCAGALPDRETDADGSQGIELAKLQELASYWRTGYDWRKAEAKFNALPQFVTRIDGIDIHFIHVRSKHPAPGLLSSRMVGRAPYRADQSRRSVDGSNGSWRRAEDAFDVVIPSMPGYGFSGKPTEAGWGPARIAATWAELMRRLGYARYVAQGGDWGSPISSEMARQAPAGLLGIHINLPAIVPPDVAAVLAAGGPAPPGLSPKERETFEQLSATTKKGSRTYALMMANSPQTIGYAITDSPVGLAAWMLGHPGFSRWSYKHGDPEKSPDEVLNDITLYWLTNTATSSARLYWEARAIGSPAFAGPGRAPKSPFR